MDRIIQPGTPKDTRPKKKEVCDSIDAVNGKTFKGKPVSKDAEWHWEAGDK